MAILDAKSRLEDIGRAISHPIATINDILTVYKPANVANYH